MESRPQNPESRNNPENFHPWDRWFEPHLRLCVVSLRHLILCLVLVLPRKHSDVTKSFLLECKALTQTKHAIMSKLSTELSVYTL